MVCAEQEEHSKENALLFFFFSFNGHLAISLNPLWAGCCEDGASALGAGKSVLEEGETCNEGQWVRAGQCVTQSPAWAGRRGIEQG